MAARYRNDYIRGISQLGTTPKNTVSSLVNKTSEESRARFSNIMNTLAQKHDEEKEVESYTPPTIERETVIRDIPREINPIIETYEPQHKETTKLSIVIILIVIMIFVAYKLYVAQKMIDDIIYRETYRR